MIKLTLPTTLIAFLFLLTTFSCKKESDQETTDDQEVFQTSFDSTLVKAFFKNHPDLKDYEADVETLYRKHKYHYVWYDKNGVNEFGSLLHNKINNIAEEGVQTSIPYKDVLDLVYEKQDTTKKIDLDVELLNTSLYFFYVDKVYHGLDTEKSTKMEWFLPREKQSYGDYLDSLLVNPSLIKKNEKGLFSQYYLLKKVLKKYRQIEKKGGWKTIEVDPDVKSFKIGDSSQTVAQIRERLFISGEIKSDSKSAIYDEALAKGVLKFKKSTGNAASTIILPSHIKDLNIPITNRINTLIVNMERCRWISKDISNAKELIAINIPAYQLTYFKKGKIVLQSNVVVGKTVNKTVIFSAPMKYIVFSPYWNVPKSIIDKEILPGIEKNENYLAQHNMEWNDGNVRQKPGPKNSLGLIKFLFPNSNAIYLHDTPSKHLFNRDQRAFSHGCIRVEKTVELAQMILDDSEKWSPTNIKKAMNSGVETWQTLKNKIPVYIGYFTAWVDEEGTTHFYNDVYKRDEPLAELLFVK